MQLAQLLGTTEQKYIYGCHQDDATDQLKKLSYCDVTQKRRGLFHDHEAINTQKQCHAQGSHGHVQTLSQFAPVLQRQDDREYGHGAFEDEQVAHGPEVIGPVRRQIEFRRVQVQHRQRVLADDGYRDQARQRDDDLWQPALPADRYHIAFVATAIQQKTEEGRQNDQIDHRILGRHQAHKLESRVILTTAHITHLSAGQRQVVRGEPDGKGNNQCTKNELDVLVVAF